MPMTQTELDSRKLFAALQPGDRVRVIHEVKVGLKSWKTETQGVVVGKERRRHGLHSRRAVDDKVWSDLLILKRDDGELTTVSIDEWTELYRA